MLDLVMFESKYVGTYFLVLVKTDLTVSQRKPSSSLLGLGRWLSGEVFALDLQYPRKNQAGSRAQWMLGADQPVQLR